MSAQLVSHQAEQAIVAATLTSGPRVSDAVLDHVQPADFDEPRWRQVLECVAELRGAGATPDVHTVAERLRARGKLELLGGEPGIDALTAHAPAAGALRQLCVDVADLARGRRRLAAAQALTHAAMARDTEGWDDGLRMLHDADTPTGTGGGWVEPQEIASRLMDSIEGADPIRWPWPLRRLNTLTGGGARRGQMTFIGGASSHGKSAYVDGALLSMAQAGAKTALFLNEMTVEERAERIASNLAHVPYPHIQQASAGERKLAPAEAREIITRMAAQPVAMVPCAGWTVEQIVREARRRRLDVLALDIVQKLPFQTGIKRHQTLEDAVQRLDAYAKDTGCHVLLVGQINRERANGTFPVPGLADIKDCAELGNGPDNVLFVWREQDPATLDPRDEGVIRIAKYRGAALETVPALFDGRFQRWAERPVSYYQQAAAA